MLCPECGSSQYKETRAGNSQSMKCDDCGLDETYQVSAGRIVRHWTTDKGSILQLWECKKETLLQVTDFLRSGFDEFYIVDLDPDLLVVQFAEKNHWKVFSCTAGEWPTGQEIERALADAITKDDVGETKAILFQD